MESLVRRLGLRNTIKNRRIAYAILRLKNVLADIRTRGQRKRIIDELKSTFDTRDRLLDNAIDITDVNTLQRFDDVINPIYRNLIKGETYQVIYLKDNKVVRVEYIRIPQRYGSFKYTYFVRQSDAPPEFHNATHIIFNRSTISPQRLKQIFRDGNTYHCVLDAVIEYFNSLSKAEPRYQRHIQKAESYKAIYPNGVPEDKMEELAKDLRIQLRYYDLFKNTDLFNKNNTHNEIIFNKHSHKNVLSFINNRQNHLEVLSNQNEEIVSQQELNEYSLIPGSLSRISRQGEITIVYTPTKKYRTEIPAYQTLINKQREQLHIHSLSPYSPYADFVKSINLIHSTPVNLSNQTPTSHKDIEKAYYNHNKAHNYRGLLGTIHQFRKLDNSFKHLIKTHLGFYTIKIKQVNHELITKLVGLIPNQVYTIFSPEIETYEPFIQYDLEAGFWGSATHIKWLPGMEKKVIINNNQISIYSIFAGQLGSHEKRIQIHTNEDFANHIATMYPCQYYKNTNTAIITIPHKSPIQDHIYASITSYTRILLFTELQKLNTDQIIRVVLDGVYFKGEDKLTNPLLKIKEIKNNFDNQGETWYSYATHEIPDFPKWETPVPLINNAFLTGQGGSGKTTAIFNDKGYNNPLYIVPTNELGRQSNKHWLTIHRLIGLNCKDYLTQGNIYPPVLVVDEMTLHTEDNINRMKKMYPHSLVIAIGDINLKTHRPYQLTIDFVDLTYRVKDEQIIHFPNDYRSKDPEIAKVKLHLRQMIDDNIPIHSQIEYLKSVFSTISLQSALELYNPTTDHFITGRHSTIPNYKTIHSIQGQTYEERTFILLDLFSIQMPYTAVSRVRNFNQIYLVSPS